MPRNARIQQIRIDIHGDSEVRKANCLKLQISLQHLQFVPNCRVVTILVAANISENGAENFRRFLSITIAAAAYQADNITHRVEHKVRAEPVSESVVFKIDELILCAQNIISQCRDFYLPGEGTVRISNVAAMEE
ncbi:MAG: hypothetical protein DHS20C04_06120 [Hyphococcus sp.]|nr:MAG: hypothetical protein DHS20C04_06120 [Marinicaulis sp.]